MKLIFDQQLSVKFHFLKIKIISPVANSDEIYWLFVVWALSQFQRIELILIQPEYPFDSVSDLNWWWLCTMESTTDTITNQTVLLVRIILSHHMIVELIAFTKRCVFRRPTFPTNGLRMVFWWKSNRCSVQNSSIYLFRSLYSVYERSRTKS